MMIIRIVMLMMMVMCVYVCVYVCVCMCVCVYVCVYALVMTGHEGFYAEDAQGQSRVSGFMLQIFLLIHTLLTHI